MLLLYLDPLRQVHQINPRGLREFARHVIMGRFFTSKKNKKLMLRQLRNKAP
jgi:hypothetical protein